MSNLPSGGSCQPLRSLRSGRLLKFPIYYVVLKFILPCKECVQQRPGKSISTMAEIALDRLERCIVDETQRSRGPKYKCVFDAFEKCIRLGYFEPGARIPSEAELSDKLPVGLGTLQKALANLAAEGLLVRTRKKGTFVADRKWQSSEVHVYRFRNPETGQVLLPFNRVLRVEVDQSNGPWHDAFRVKRFVRIDRLVWVNQDPPAFNSAYLSYKHGKDLLGCPVEELHGASFHRVLIERFNLPTLRMEHKIGCRALSDAACENLLLKQGTIGSIWDITDYSFDDNPVFFQRYQLPPGHRPIEMIEKTGG
jgi:GntR family transcriptional regulator